MRLAPSHDRSTFNCGSSASWVAVTRSAVRSAGLERVRSLIFIPPIHGGSLSKENAYGLTFGYWLNFKQATLVAMWSDTGGAVAYGDLSLRNDKLTFNHHRVAMSAEPKYRQEWLQVQPLAVGPLPSCVARSDKQKSLSTGQWQNRLVLRL